MPASKSKPFFSWLCPPLIRAAAGTFAGIIGDFFQRICASRRFDASSAFFDISGIARDIVALRGRRAAEARAVGNGDVGTGLASAVGSRILSVGAGRFFETFAVA